jgi:hypothetical protein
LGEPAQITREDHRRASTLYQTGIVVCSFIRVVSLPCLPTSAAEPGGNRQRIGLDYRGQPSPPLTLANRRPPGYALVRATKSEQIPRQRQQPPGHGPAIERPSYAFSRFVKRL